ncbi:MAG: hypothetical protein EAZ78_26110 [Oscillatoriales cyanobacterium]|uniref:Uncharacterized protein n=1 Tax=Microcoleus anatoxicus PTRS2 TaxID=2705321 RepID=A0ABU8YUJ9_9CYAN|nr:MAG: hypothetical protein EA000_16120 [Oscillatoriales cyanobacterium]TAE04866.1 MAG: hypothetical protein EAZ96_07580 [Oscillatoriales cyanobacterium]TAE97186.1 MAG: hypothetical protein EAZ78_26110 [Oscillatoriales cyanobacterium]TAF30114.1 MAG: hypothetical protein EAZ68_23265 [Oscillatoriales cyanobacterium]TAF59848.1 MAG: hypothetical protein EAZ59_27065 [Oscillatoriales cyanobacterium]
MVNSLILGDNDLVPVDYGDLLDKILEVLQGKNPFSVSGDKRRLLIDIDAVAAQISSLNVRLPLGGFERQAHSATVNFTPELETQFGTQIRQIRQYLRQHLASVVGGNDAIENFVASLIEPLESRSFQGNGQELGFKYDFAKPSPILAKKKLTLQRPNTVGTTAILKLHKLTIAVRDSDIFQQQLKEGLEHYINENADTESDGQELHRLLNELVKDENSDFHKLLKLVDKETLGKLNKEAKITYLEYLLEHICTSSTDSVGIIYLEDLIRRIRLLEAYISDRTKEDGYYNVNYAGVKVNYQDMFSRAEVLDALPIIPIVTGYLGETTDTHLSERKYIFGLKLKFGNEVQARGGKPVFDYNLNLLNPDSDEHKAELADDYTSETFIRKVLKIALLYYFVFASRSNPLAADYNSESELTYDPRQSFETVISVLRGSDEEKKKSIFRGIKRGLTEYNVAVKINRLKQLLKDFIDRQTILPTRTEPRHISVKRGILEDLDNAVTTGRFFNDVLQRNPKQSLQYIAVEQSSINETAICQLPVTITIEDVRYFPTDEFQNFSMEYNIKDINTLPVLWVPESLMSVYSNSFSEQYKLLLFRYNNKRLDSKDGLKPDAAFVYKFAVSLLSYICLEILLNKAKKTLFIPMVRLHEADEKNPFPSEKFMANVSKTLSHLFSEKYRSTSQGFRVKQKPNAYSMRNGLSSLYSILPKKFKFRNVPLSPELNNLAIIVVSSCESDAKKGNSDRFQRKTCLLGEVAGIKRLSEDTIQVGMLKTLSENYSVEHLYSQPSILEDTVSQLYKYGYRNFLYIAQAPYTSTLHITQTDEDEQLFFMSKKLIQTLKGERQDIRIYPVFFDKYYVRSPKEHKGESFYIQDTMELEGLSKDPSQQAVMFFNLFNGIKVEQQGQKNFYNGVISYSTLLNIYEGILDDQDIRQGLMYDGEIKDTLLHYLTIFHFSRYEARQQISLKLDPYSHIIGDDSVGALSIFNHAGGSAEFNSLAFLNKVREVLNVGDGGTQS